MIQLDRFTFLQERSQHSVEVLLDQETIVADHFQRLRAIISLLLAKLKPMIGTMNHRFIPQRKSYTNAKCLYLEYRIRCVDLNIPAAVTLIHLIRWIF